mmetsp:Transcript_61068/g.144082  ORF Transcript_61068/g.144082 Transcript_61068/m.144082 type:complete len:204 (+) Transcript_61068:590-1201(+)
MLLRRGREMLLRRGREMRWSRRSCTVLQALPQRLDVGRDFRLPCGEVRGWSARRRRGGHLQRTREGRIEVDRLRHKGRRRIHKWHSGKSRVWDGVRRDSELRVWCECCVRSRSLGRGRRRCLGLALLLVLRSASQPLPDAATICSLGPPRLAHLYRRDGGISIGLLELRGFLLWRPMRARDIAPRASVPDVPDCPITGFVFIS